MHYLHDIPLADIRANQATILIASDNPIAHFQHISTNSEIKLFDRPDEFGFIELSGNCKKSFNEHAACIRFKSYKTS